MSRAVRTRRNRRDDDVRGLMLVTGAVIDAHEYSTGRVDVRVTSAVPGSADQLGAWDDCLLPEP